MELRLPAQRSAVRAARHWVVSQARAAGVPAPRVPLIELLTSEVVANAVVHGDAHDLLTVSAERLDGGFRVGVTDGAPGLPVLRETGPEVPGGHGVRLVDTLAAAWGVEPRSEGGKTVWFRLTV